MEEWIMTAGDIEDYVRWLYSEEKSKATIVKYETYLKRYYEALSEAEKTEGNRKTGSEARWMTKEDAVRFKEEAARERSVSTVNGMVAALNGFFGFKGWQVRLKPLRRQKQIFIQKEKELSRKEYQKLLQAAKGRGKERLWLMLQTICATGIRVSELQFITAEAIAQGRAEVDCKGKRRVILIPRELCGLLKNYMRKEKREEGSVFCTRNGKQVNRSNLWREMKKLCFQAGVPPEKVSPHRLRHLFARCFYALERDIAKLADVLGHSSITTTRIYIMTTSEEHEKQVAKLGLLDLAT